MMDPAGEVNEKGTRGENDGIETLEEGVSLPLDLNPKEEIKADDKTLPYAEENWYDPEQNEKPKNTEQDLPFIMQTREIPAKQYNPYGDKFMGDRTDLTKVAHQLLGLEEIIAGSRGSGHRRRLGQRLG